MIKLKTSKKIMREGYYRIISIGYCDAQYLLKYENPIAYSAGVYGWCCDYYDIDGVLISTGYSPLSDKNVRKDYNLVREYDKLASVTEGADVVKKMLRDMVKELSK